jgi:hypothetical protein
MGLRPLTTNVWTDLRLDSSGGFAWSTGESVALARMSASPRQGHHWVYREAYGTWPDTNEASVIIEWSR